MFGVTPLSLVSSSQASHPPAENLGARSHSPRVPAQPLTPTPLCAVFMGTSREGGYLGLSVSGLFASIMPVVEACQDSPPPQDGTTPHVHTDRFSLSFTT